MLLVLVDLLHDSAGLPAPVREAFKEKVALLMGEAGIAIQITDCAVGRAELNRNECMEPTGHAADSAWSEADLMAHTAAHEIAHLVLGPDAHDTGGIMRSAWPAGRLNRTPHRELGFNSSQARALRQALASQ